MKDLVITGNGNSRYLKSSLASGTSWADALALLRAGTFPIDLNGLNNAGVSTAGSAYSKANVLPDAVCSSLGITSSTAEPKDAFNALLQKINTGDTAFNNFISNDWPYPYKQGVPRPNLLDNAYFVGGGSQNGNGRFPINQKGSTSYSGSGYCIDRWKKYNGNGSVSLGNAGLTIIGTGSAYNYVDQPIEYSNKLFGKQVTVSLLNTSGALTSATCTLPSSLPSSTTRYATATAIGNTRISILGSASYFYVEMDNTSTTGTAVQACKLELGPNQTLARQVNNTWVLNEIPNFATELNKCQRFMVVFKAVHTGNDYSYSDDVIGIGRFSRYRAINAFIPLPVTMRATPTMSGNIAAHYTSHTGSSYENTWTTLTASEISSRYLHANGLSFYSANIYSESDYTNYINDAVILAPYYNSPLILDANL